MTCQRRYDWAEDTVKLMLICEGGEMKCGLLSKMIRNVAHLPCGNIRLLLFDSNNEWPHPKAFCSSLCGSVGDGETLTSWGTSVGISKALQTTTRTCRSLRLSFEEGGWALENWPWMKLFPVDMHSHNRLSPPLIIISVISLAFYFHW